MLGGLIPARHVVLLLTKGGLPLSRSHRETHQGEIDMLFIRPNPPSYKVDELDCVCPDLSYSSAPGYYHRTCSLTWLCVAARPVCVDWATAHPTPPSLLAFTVASAGQPCAPSDVVADRGCAGVEPAAMDPVCQVDMVHLQPTLPVLRQSTSAEPCRAHPFACFAFGVGQPTGASAPHP